jgi:hypothetical protein
LVDYYFVVFQKKKVLDRIEGQLGTAQNQSDAVDRNFMRESDPRMPVLPCT